MPISIAIVDDHHLVAAAFADLIRRFDNYKVLLTAEHGRDLLNQLAQSNQLPDIVLLDVSMPVMNGFDTALALKTQYPQIHILALSMEDHEDQIIRMIRNGARGYLLKDCRPNELRQALDDMMAKGYYYSDFLTSMLLTKLTGPDKKDQSLPFNLSERELAFVRLACSESTYPDIASQLSVSPRTVDGYRETVFQKMNVSTRVGMVLQAIRHRLIEL